MMIRSGKMIIMVKVAFMFYSGTVMLSQEIQGCNLCLQN